MNQYLNYSTPRVVRTTVTREFDEKGRVVKEVTETVTEQQNYYMPPTYAGNGTTFNGYKGVMPCTS